MPKYVIERDLPGAGNLSPEELKETAKTSYNILKEMGPEIQWLNSYVTDDKIYCVFIAPNKQMIEEHAEKGGFPLTKIAKVHSMMDPTTSE